MRDSEIRSSTTSLHAPRLVVDDRKEALARGGIDIVGLLAKRFGIADQCRKRSAQLVACIGDEIDAHLLGGAGFAAVHEPDQRGALAEPSGSHQPMPTRSIQTRELDLAIGFRVRAFQCLQRSRMHNHPLDRRALDVFPEKHAGASIRRPDPAADRNQRCFAQPFEHCGFSDREIDHRPPLEPRPERRQRMRTWIAERDAPLLERRAMSKTRWLAAAAALSLVACQAATTNQQNATRARAEAASKAATDKLARVEMQADASYLTDEERKVVNLLIQAADLMNPIYLRQVSADNPRIREEIVKSGDKAALWIGSIRSWGRGTRSTTTSRSTATPRARSARASIPPA